MPNPFKRVHNHSTELKHIGYSSRTIINEDHIELSLTEWPNGEGWTLNTYHESGTSNKVGKSSTVELCSEEVELLRKCLGDIPEDESSKGYDIGELVGPNDC